jgi:16S rRNA (guanine527-N7)-methyltransferase
LNYSGRPQPEKILLDGLEELKISFDDKKISLLLRFQEIYQEWSSRINLSTILSPEEFIIKHVLDSAAGIPYFPARPGKIADLGSGGGFPGIILKILNPQWKIVLLEVVQKKVRYLETAIMELGLDIQVINSTHEKVGRDYDTITCRAFGNLEKINREGKKYLKKGGLFLAYKGKRETIEREMNPTVQKTAKIIPINVPFLEGERHLVRWKLI